MEFHLSWENVVLALGMASGWYAAVSARRKLEGDLPSQAVSAASQSVALREKDIVYLELKIHRLEKEVKRLEEYSEYLWKWIRHNAGRRKMPLELDEYNEPQVVK